VEAAVSVCCLLCALGATDIDSSRSSLSSRLGKGGSGEMSCEMTNGEGWRVVEGVVCLKFLMSSVTEFSWACMVV
jgi:hypothetical protein